MKKSFILLISLILTIIYSCASVQNRFLPANDNINSSPYGGYVMLKMLNKEKVSGELIAVHNDTIVVLVSKKDNLELEYIDRKELKTYKIKFARSSRDYKKWMGINALTLLHDWWLITLPLNIVISTWVAISTKSKYQFDQEKLPFKGLRKYSRFPQGIPTCIEREELMAPYSTNKSADSHNIKMRK